MTRTEEADLRSFIDRREYEPVFRNFLGGTVGALPEKKQIQKVGTEKKRVVYLYPRAENYVFKLLTFLLTREYDGVFSDTLYSFRVRLGVRRAMDRILHLPGLNGKYTYKADIHDYFNSIPVPRMLAVLRPVLEKEPETFALFEAILTDRRVLKNGAVTEENKGVMAGTPFAVFLANLYLKDMDREFAESGIAYARYSDDILVLADSEENREAAAARILAILSENGLTVNEEKEVRTVPGERWTFLGISYDSGTVDVSPVARDKLKAKMRRKARAIKRWQVRRGLSPDKAVKAFIRKMNSKFFDADSAHELTWTRWYFPVINTDATLYELDHYMQEWIRYLATDRHGKKQYAFRYEQMKALGYVSLVHEWHKG